MTLIQRSGSALNLNIHFHMLFLDGVYITAQCVLPLVDQMIRETDQVLDVVELGFVGETKTPITAADLLNDRVLPLFAQQKLPLLRVLTDRGTEYCGRAERHDYELYLALNDIDYTKTKAKTPQTNGICERFHKTVLQEFYQVTFRKKLYANLEDLQADLDVWIAYYNTEKPHQGKTCCGRTPMETLEEEQESGERSS